VAFSHVSPLSHVLPCFPIKMLSSLHLVIFRHPYLTHTKSDFRNLKCYEFSTSFSLHLPFRFRIKNKYHVVEECKELPLHEFRKLSYESQGQPASHAIPLPWPWRGRAKATGRLATQGVFFSYSGQHLLKKKWKSPSRSSIFTRFYFLKI
jgi:hypothetical protein